jgi:hypothetical protein
LSGKREMTVLLPEELYLGMNDPPWKRHRVGRKYVFHVIVEGHRH